MPGLYFEEFAVGQVFDHEWTRTVTEMDNTLFSTLTLNVAPIHIDAHYCEGTEFGQRIVNSMFTLGLIIGISVNDTTLRTTVANLGMTDVRFPNPVFHGDTLRSRSEVKAVRESRSRPQAGIVEFEHVGLNQRDEVVVTCLRSGLMMRRPTPA